MLFITPVFIFKILNSSAHITNNFDRKEQPVFSLILGLYCSRDVIIYKILSPAPVQHNSIQACLTL